MGGDGCENLWYLASAAVPAQVAVAAGRAQRVLTADWPNQRLGAPSTLCTGSTPCPLRRFRPDSSLLIPPSRICLSPVIGVDLRVCPRVGVGPS